MKEKFTLVGFYNSSIVPSGKVRFDGEIEFEENGEFEGSIYDYGSMAKEQFIRGHFFKEGDLEKIAFL